MAEQSTTLSTTLVPEILGFSPQMLLDDIISEAGDAILQCLTATELFMRRWADARAESVGEDWDGVAAVEQVSHKLLIPLFEGEMFICADRVW